MDVRWTRTQERLLALFADGLWHSKKALLACLEDDMAVDGTLRCHLANIRKKLPTGQAIVCEVDHRRYGWRQVRLLRSSNE